LQLVKKDFLAAETALQEALGIYRSLTVNDPQTHLPDMAITLNNLASLQVKNETPDAEATFQEALNIFTRLVKTNPKAYQPYIAGILNNLATLCADKNDFPAAGIAFQKALTIYRDLSKDNPFTYLPDVAMTSGNMSSFYLKSVPKRAKSLAYAKEALIAGLPFVETIPMVRSYIGSVLAVAEAWGINRRVFLKKQSILRLNRKVKKVNRIDVNSDDKHNVSHLNAIGKIAFRIWFDVAYTTVTESMSELISCKLQTTEEQEQVANREYYR